jgi:hypothetical protein
MMGNAKEAYFIECVKEAAKSLGLKNIPKVKVWEGACPYSSGDEIAHAHPDLGLICISRGRLESMNLDEIRETAFHETTHMLYIGHDIDFGIAMDDTHLAAWLEEHKPRTITFKSKKEDKDKIDKEKCNYHLCRKKTKLYRCKYCGNYFCKEHLKPKMCLTLHQISTAKEPLRSWLEKEYRREDGHPDLIYTKIAWQKLEAREKEELEKRWKALDILDKEPKIERGIEKEEFPEHVPKQPITSFPRIRVPKIVVIALFFVLLLELELMFFRSYFILTINILVAVVTIYLLYKLFVKASKIEITSDLRLFGLRILSVIVLILGGFFLYLALMTTIFSTIYSSDIELIYNPFSIFFGILGLGLILLSSYLIFRFMLRSGVIVYHR